MYRDPTEIDSYHAHVYYDEASKPIAEAMVADMQTRFPDASYGRWHDRPIGPHPDWSIQIAFDPELLQPISAYLMLNRKNLVIFLHPNTEDAVADHRDHPMWLGAVRPINIAFLERIIGKESAE